MSTLTELFTSIANSIRAKKGTSALIEAEDFPTEIAGIETGALTQAEYTEAVDDVDDILEDTTLPSGTINITTNGSHDVANYLTANVNVASSTYVLPDGIRFGYTSQFPSGFTTSNLTTMYNFLNNATITSLPSIDTSNVENMENAFYNCQYLTTLPLLDTGKIINFRNAFTNCFALTNESLNNILQMIANATTYNSVKTLKWIGLTSTQATTCTGLSNWAAAQTAGWTTGY